MKLLILFESNLVVRADYKNNEQEVFKRLNHLEEMTEKGKKGNMNDAVDSNEQIR